jgi:Protein of unknown function (DUF4238)
MQQHIVPVLSLKHFADPRGHVWTFDKTLKTCRSSLPEETSTCGHYYSVERKDGSMDTTIENVFAAVENEAAPIYERLVAGEMPKGGGRETFAQFLAIMYARSPQSRRLGADAARFLIETQVAATAAHDGAFRTFLKKLEADGMDVSDPERVRNALLDMSHSNLILPKQYALMPIGAAPRLAELFLNLKWSLFHAESHFFITCDNPIYRAVDAKSVHPIYGDHGLLNKTAQITFPLSPKRLLFMQWELNIPTELPMTDKWVKLENIKRVQAADRQIYVHFEYRKLARLAARFKETMNPVARRKGFAGSTGFADVIVPRKWPKERPKK